MEYFYLDSKTELKNNTAVALGFFDGVHLGHMQLVNTMIKEAQDKDLEPCILTFDKHPLTLAFPKFAPKLITTNEDKINIFGSANVDKLVFLNFDDEMMNYEPTKFVEDILVKQLKVKSVIIGFNYTFGHKGMGKASLLMELGKKYEFDVHVVAPYEVEGQVISSTFIRNLISAGKIEEIDKYLGRKYTLRGKVIRGKGLGRKLDFPTANIELANDLLTPQAGVYYTTVEYKGNDYHGLTNIGHNPTFENHPFSVETYIYDFSEEIYDEEIVIYFHKRIREEKKFESLADLVKQIKNDIYTIKKQYVDRE